MVALNALRAAAIHNLILARCSFDGKKRIFLDFVTIRVQAVDAASEDLDNGDEVGDKLGLRGVYSTVENHDPSTVFLDKPLDEFKSKTTQSVSVGNHNFFDKSALAEFQYLAQAFSFKVEAAADIGDDFVTPKL